MLSFFQASATLHQPSRIMRSAQMSTTVSPAASAAAAGYENDRFAGRYPVGKNLAAVEAKSGFNFDRVNGDVRVLGGACSEGPCTHAHARTRTHLHSRRFPLHLTSLLRCHKRSFAQPLTQSDRLVNLALSFVARVCTRAVLGGQNLAKLLRSGYELEVAAMEALEAGKPAPALSVHTSIGVPKEMDRFLAALERHIPSKTGDWCVNLQAEGGSAVHAAVDMGLQLFRAGEDFNKADARTRVACGASSYHGPASTSPGGTQPRGARQPRAAARAAARMAATRAATARAAACVKRLVCTAPWVRVCGTRAWVCVFVACVHTCVRV